MTPETSAAAIALRPPASLYVGLRPARPMMSLPAISFAPAVDGAVAVTRAGPEHGLRRLVSGLGDVALLLAVGYTFPLAILAVGIPIALLVRLVMWLVGAH